MIHVFKRKDAKTGDLTFNLGAMHRRGKPWHAIKWKGPAHHGSYPIDGREYSSDGWRYPVDVVFSLPADRGGPLRPEAGGPGDPPNGHPNQSGVTRFWTPTRAREPP